jgi:hypothetical protein
MNLENIHIDLKNKKIYVDNNNLKESLKSLHLLLGDSVIDDFDILLDYKKENPKLSDEKLTANFSNGISNNVKALLNDAKENNLASLKNDNSYAIKILYDNNNRCLNLIQSDICNLAISPFLGYINPSKDLYLDLHLFGDTDSKLNFLNYATNNRSKFVVFVKQKDKKTKLCGVYLISTDRDISLNDSSPSIVRLHFNYDYCEYLN